VATLLARGPDLYVSHLTLHDFRSYPELELELGPGPIAFVGRNGQGKTNIVEAIDYLSRLASHRVSSDAPLVRSGAEQAVVRAAVVKDGRTATLEVELNPGRANRARVNRAQLPRARELIGLVRTVVFSPEDLSLVKGDPSERRAFLDDLLVLRTPRFAGVRSDYDRILRQRNSLLKTARPGPGSAQRREAALATLDVWDEQLARVGAEILAARLELVDALRPYVGTSYEAVARGASREDAAIEYKPSLELGVVSRRAAPSSTTEGSDLPVVEERADASVSKPRGAEDLPVVEERADASVSKPLGADDLSDALLAEIQRRRSDELDRGLSLVGPHRDELLLTLSNGETRLPVRGYASHGESWSFALALRLAAYDLLRHEGDDPILILDDVFAELDTQRRGQLAAIVAGAEQVLVTAAVGADVPEALAGRRFVVEGGTVQEQSGQEQSGQEQSGQEQSGQEQSSRVETTAND
jgi:DNA replication and repair protein RecF